MNASLTLSPLQNTSFHSIKGALQLFATNKKQTLFYFLTKNVDFIYSYTIVI